MSFDERTSVTTPVLSVDYETKGKATGYPVVLLHGFPYDVRAYDASAEMISAAGAYVIAPYLRGFGRTRFLDENTMRSGQQAALGLDLIDLLDALGIERAWSAVSTGEAAQHASQLPSSPTGSAAL
jgi:pimeloyl-ACP methyl ester carboxylesterase